MHSTGLLGQTYQGLGLLDPAERELREALAGRQALPAPDAAEVARAQEAVASLSAPERRAGAGRGASIRQALAGFERAGQGDGEHALTARRSTGATCAR